MEKNRGSDSMVWIMGIFAVEATDIEGGSLGDIDEIERREL